MSIKHLYEDERPSLLLDFANSKTLDPRITFSRNSTATYVDELGIIKTAADNEARIDHDPATGECLGLLIEESRTNSFQNSVFTQTSDWLTSNPTTHGTVTANNATAPDGTSTAAALVAGGQTDRVISMGLTTTNDQTVFSFFVKKGTGDNLQFGSLAWTTQGAINYTFSTDTFGTNYNLADYGKEDYGNGWIRIWIRFGAAGSGTVYVRWGDASPSGTTGWFWGVQQELGTFPTSYIPTSGSTITRNADEAEITGTNFSSWYNQSEGTICAKFRSQWPDGEDTTILQQQSGGDIRIFAYTSYNRVQFLYGSSYTYSNNHSSGYPAASDFSSAAIFYTDDGTTSSVGGSFQGFPVVSTTGTGGVNVTGLKFAPFPGASGGLQASTAHLSRISYYNTRLSNTTLEALTK